MITQAICDYRRAQRIGGPLHLGKDTHALSSPAERTALEVLAANGVETRIQRGASFSVRKTNDEIARRTEETVNTYAVLDNLGPRI